MRACNAPERRLPLKHLVVDVSRCVPSFDVTAVAAFEKTVALGEARGFDLAIAPSESCAGSALFCALSADGALARRVAFFETVDDALERAEDETLRRVKKTTTKEPEETACAPDATRSARAGCGEQDSAEDLFKVWLLDADDGDGGVSGGVSEACSKIARIAHVRRCARGEELFSNGDPGRDELVLVCSGRLRLVDDASAVCVRKLVLHTPPRVFSLCVCETRAHGLSV